MEYVVQRPWLLVVLLLCLVGVFASGKLKQTLGVCVGGALAWAAMLPFGGAILCQALSVSPNPAWAQQVPFMGYILQACQGPSDFTPVLLFDGSMDWAVAGLFLVLLLCDILLTLEEMLESELNGWMNWASGLPGAIGSVVGFIARLVPWLLRYITCVGAGAAAFFLIRYLNRVLPQEIWLIFGKTVLVAMFVMALAPLAKLIATAAKLTGNPAAKVLSSFLDQNPVGEVLQEVFFAQLLLLLLLCGLLESGFLYRALG